MNSPITHLDSSIDHLRDALDRISSWMTANLLTLNSSKTEFLLIGLSKQLAKINNSSLTTTHSARNLGFIYDEHLTFFDQISSVSKSCYYHIRQLRILSTLLAEILHGVQNSETGYLTLTTTLSGKIFLRQGGTCYDKLMYQIRSL